MSVGAVIARRYRLDALLGSGGMGTVYRAADLRADGSAVAVKLLEKGSTGSPASPPPPDVARFEAEAAALASIRHDDVVRYVTHGFTDEGRPFLVMEWVEGETLHETLVARGVSPAEAARVAARLVRALASVHAAGVVHRDVKPRNVMFAPGPPFRLKLVDFGIARTTGASGVTATGTVLGTPRYMAPEQIRSARRADGRADVFAVGCVLFEMLTGRPTFEGDDPFQVLARMMVEDARAPRRLRPDLPPAADRLVARLLTRDRRHRPVASEALAEELELLAKALGELALPAVPFDSRPLFVESTFADAPVPLSARRGFAPLKPSFPPASPGLFVGRRAEMGLLGARARAAGTVVSLWGAIGMGKSRLAVESAREAASAREVAVVGIGAVKTLEALSMTVGSALGLAQPSDDAIARALAARGMLLVLDGADAMLDAVVEAARAWVLSTLETATASIVVVARARASSADAAIEVGPLDQEAAENLFASRAAELGVADSVRVDAVRARVARALGGSPLLLELAAARLDVLGPEGLTSALLQPLEALEGARAPGYGSTLVEAVSALWDALDESGRACLACASMFSSPVDLPMVAEVASAVGVTRALGALRRLRDAGMLVRAADAPSGEPRFTVPPVLRAFAVGSGVVDVALARRAVADAVLATAADVTKDLATSIDAAARKRLGHLAPDLVAIVEHALAADPLEGDMAVRAILALDAGSAWRAPVVDQLAVLERALTSLAPSGARATLEVEGAIVRGRLLSLRRRDEDARLALVAAVEGASSLGVDLALRARLELGVARHTAGDLPAARAAYEAVLACGDEAPARVELRALGNLGALHHDLHELEPAYARYVEAVALAEALPDERLLGVLLGNLAILDRDRGDLVRARARFVRALEVLEAVGDVRLSAMTLANLGLLELERGRTAAGTAALESARTGLARVGDVRSEALTLARLVVSYALEGRHEDAVKVAALAARAGRGDALVSGVVELAKGAVELARGDHAAVEARLLAAARPLDVGRSLLQASDDARAIQRVLRARMAGAR